ncbi:class I SAM-dependent methyltransferase [Silanimonas algicola]
MGRVLVFPAGMPRAIEFAKRALGEGESIVGSSSLAFDPAAPLYPAWERLPFVTEDGFEEALIGAIDHWNVDRLFTPNVVAWKVVAEIIARRRPAVRLIGGPPVDRELAPYRDAKAFAADACRRPLPLPGARDEHASTFTPHALASIFKHVESVPGMCDHEKIRAMFSVFENVPQGDIVEIGSWWGKSAVLLHQLSRLRGTGPVLCVDPWAEENLPQGDEKGLVDGARMSAAEAFEVFIMSLLPYADGSLNYIRLPAEDARTRYIHAGDVFTSEFGRTAYAGRIALLHVDGNHAYAHAKADVVGWSPLVVAGGWVVVDDYVWPYGDGPRRAGDELLADWAGRYDCAFVAGSALFVRRSSAE